MNNNIKIYKIVYTGGAYVPPHRREQKSQPGRLLSELVKDIISLEELRKKGNLEGIEMSQPKSQSLINQYQCSRFGKTHEMGFIIYQGELCFYNFYDNPVTPFMAEVLLKTPYTIIELYTLDTDGIGDIYECKSKLPFKFIKHDEESSLKDESLKGESYKKGQIIVTTPFYYDNRPQMPFLFRKKEDKLLVVERFKFPPTDDYIEEKKRIYEELYREKADIFGKKYPFDFSIPSLEILISTYTHDRIITIKDFPPFFKLEANQIEDLRKIIDKLKVAFEYPQTYNLFFLLHLKEKHKFSEHLQIHLEVNNRFTIKTYADTKMNERKILVDQFLDMLELDENYGYYYLLRNAFRYNDYTLEKVYTLAELHKTKLNSANSLVDVKQSLLEEPLVRGARDASIFESIPISIPKGAVTVSIPISKEIFVLFLYQESDSFHGIYHKGGKYFQFHRILVESANQNYDKIKTYFDNPVKSVDFGINNEQSLKYYLHDGHVNNYKIHEKEIDPKTSLFYKKSLQFMGYRNVDLYEYLNFGQFDISKMSGVTSEASAQDILSLFPNNLNIMFNNFALHSVILGLGTGLLPKYKEYLKPEFKQYFKIFNGDDFFVITGLAIEQLEDPNITFFKRIVCWYIPEFFKRYFILNKSENTGRPVIFQSDGNINIVKLEELIKNDLFFRFALLSLLENNKEKLKLDIMSDEKLLSYALKLLNMNYNEFSQGYLEIPDSYKDELQVKEIKGIPTNNLQNEQFLKYIPQEFTFYKEKINLSTPYIFVDMNLNDVSLFIKVFEYFRGIFGIKFYMTGEFHSKISDVEDLMSLHLNIFLNEKYTFAKNADKELMKEQAKTIERQSRFNIEDLFVLTKHNFEKPKVKDILKKFNLALNIN